VILARMLFLVSGCRCGRRKAKGKETILVEGESRTEIQKYRKIGQEELPTPVDCPKRQALLVVSSVLPSDCKHASAKDVNQNGEICAFQRETVLLEDLSKLPHHEKA
jgi:hypothetical protein